MGKENRFECNESDYLQNEEDVKSLFESFYSAEISYLESEPNIVKLNETFKELDDKKLWGEFPEASKVARIINLFRSETEGMVEDVVQTLLKIGKPSVIPLINALDSKYETIRSEAAGVLGLLGDERAYSPLVKMLRSNSYHNAAVAARALGQLGNIEAIEPLLRILAHENENVRYCVVEALGHLGRGNAQVINVLNLMKKRIYTNLCKWEMQW